MLEMDRAAKLKAEIAARRRRRKAARKANLAGGLAGGIGGGLKGGFGLLGSVGKGLGSGLGSVAGGLGSRLGSVGGRSTGAPSKDSEGSGSGDDAAHVDEVAIEVNDNLDDLEVEVALGEEKEGDNEEGDDEEGKRGEAEFDGRKAGWSRLRRTREAASAFDNRRGAGEDENAGGGDSEEGKAGEGGSGEGKAGEDGEEGEAEGKAGEDSTDKGDAATGASEEEQQEARWAAALADEQTHEAIVAEAEIVLKESTLQSAKVKAQEELDLKKKAAEPVKVLAETVRKEMEKKKKEVAARKKLELQASTYFCFNTAAKDISTDIEWNEEYQVPGVDSFHVVFFTVLERETHTFLGQACLPTADMFGMYGRMEEVVLPDICLNGDV